MLATSSSLILPLFDVHGSPRELGHAYGTALRDVIARFVPMRFAAVAQYTADAGTGDLEGLLAVGRESYPIFREFDAAGFEEHEATARAAGVDPVELFTAGNMTDMRDAVILAGAGPTRSVGGPSADAEGCSSALIPSSATIARRQLAGQTWDLNPEDLDYVVGVRRRPTGGPSSWAVTVAGCPTLVGMNEHGLTVGTTNIKTWGSKPGVGYLNVLHKMLRCTNVAEAMAVVTSAPRSGAHTFWAADGSRAVELETSPDRVVAREASAGAVIRTNHCLAAGIVESEWQAPTASSVQRLTRLTGLLSGTDQSVSTLRAAFSDRSDGTNSVNRYPEDGQGTATNAVVIAEPDARLFHCCRGPADRGEWVTLRFD